MPDTSTVRPLVYFSYINEYSRVAMLSDDTICEVTDLLDEFGDETDDPDDASIVIVKINENAWCTVELEAIDLPWLN